MIGIYVRVSTEEQAKKGTSLSEQLRECRKKAQSANVKEYIDDGYSGEFLERPALNQLREDVKNGIITKVITLDPDRWSRNLMNQLIITDEIERRAELSFVNGDYAKTPEGRLFYQLRGAISEFEKAKINERMMRGRRGRAREGKILRDYQVYGYNYDKETRSFCINEEEAAVVRFIFDIFTSPQKIYYTENGEQVQVKGINGIAKYLTYRGVPTKRGGDVWHRQVVRQILMNRAYIGEFYQNKWNTEGMLGNKHRSPEDKVKIRLRSKEEWIRVEIPAIISEVQFEHAQRLLGEAKRRWAKQGAREYLLSGLLRCGKCGNTMTGRRSKYWRKHILEYTDIKNYSGAKFRGCGMKKRCDELDRIVWEHVENYLNNFDAILNAEMEVAATTYEEGELDRITKQLEKVKEGRKRLLKLFALGDMDFGEDEIRDELKALKEEEEKLEERKMELEASLSQTKGNEHSRKILEEAVNYYMGIGKDDLTFEDKKTLIRYVIREIVVHDDELEIYAW